MPIINLGNGAVCEIHNDGSKLWWLNGKRHRTDGPACEYAHGHKCWCINGKLHRTDGPALEYSDGRKFWYINDIQYSLWIFKRNCQNLYCRMSLREEIDIYLTFE
jgi:hypothetical protein